MKEKKIGDTFIVYLRSAEGSLCSLLINIQLKTHSVKVKLGSGG